MATAAELLLNASSGDDTTLVIDNYLRTIAIPKRITNLGVVADDDVLRLNFRMPRYLDDTDLSTFSIRINYVNAHGDGDAYTVNDKVVGDKHITFSWLVGPTATAYKGETNFIVCMKTLNSEGYIEKEYNTTIATLPVLEGLEVDEQIVEAYSDIIEQWRRELFGIGDTEEASIRTVSQEEQENIAQKGIEVLATIPEDYQTTYKNAEEAARTKADAIINTVQGEMVSVSDSSDDYLRGLRVFGKTTQVSTTGKNLFQNTATSKVVNGLSFSVREDGIVTITGTATENTFFKLGSFTLDNGEYYLSGCSNGSVSTYLLYFQKPVGGGEGYVHCLSGDEAFTISDSDKRDLIIAVYAGVTVQYLTMYPMIRKVENTDGTYEPYSGCVMSPSPSWPQKLTSVGETGDISVKIFGKNLLKESAIPATMTQNGITCEYEGDGVFHIYGTYKNTTSAYQFATTWLDLPVDPDAYYTISVKMLEGYTPFSYHPYVGLSSDTIGHRNWIAVHVESGTAVGSIERNRQKPSDSMTDPKFINKFWIYTYNGTGEEYTTDFRIQVWLEKDEYSSEHTPYTEQDITVSLPIRGIPVTKNGTYTDVNGQQWVCDEIDFERGVYIQRIGHRVLDGVNVRPYHATHSNGQHYCAIYPGDIAKDSQVISSNYAFVPINRSDADLTLYGIGGAIIINDNRFNSADDVVSLWSNELPEVQYVLATPVENPLTAEEIVAYKALCTNYPNTTVINDSSAWMELKYNVDTKTYLDNLPKATDEQVQASVSAWLEAHFASAEGVSF